MDMDIDELADIIRLYLMENGDSIMRGICEGIDSTGIHRSMARYIASKM